MKKGFLWSIAIAPTIGVSALFAGATMAEEREPEFDNSGYGAVLCIAAINASHKAYIDTCRPEGGEEMSKAFGQSMADIAKFSGENGKATEEGYASLINGFYDSEIARANKQGAKYCTSKSVQEFNAPLSKITPEDIQKGTAKMLSVPRKPLMAPCL